MRLHHTTVYRKKESQRQRYNTFELACQIYRPTLTLFRFHVAKGILCDIQTPLFTWYVGAIACQFSNSRLSRGLRVPPTCVGYRPTSRFFHVAIGFGSC